MSRKTLLTKQQKSKQQNRTQNRDAESIFRAIQATQMVSLLALRNEGWGAKRLKKFSDEFNNLVNGISQGYISLQDITDMLEKETGLTKDDLTLKSARRL